MLPEYGADFFKRGVRGKYHAAYQKGAYVTIHHADGTATRKMLSPPKGASTIEPTGNAADTETGIDGKLAPSAEPARAVMLDADIAKVFKNAAVVNTALRLVIQMAGDGTDAK